MRFLRLSCLISGCTVLLGACGGGSGSAHLGGIPAVGNSAVHDNALKANAVGNPDADAGIKRIYIASHRSNAITTYTKGGMRIDPTITDGVTAPVGLATDANGNIYVGNAGNATVTTYKPNGTPTNPTITVGINQPYGIAIDAAGKIYVANTG